jgi:hypothetical protein
MSNYEKLEERVENLEKKLELAIARAKERNPNAKIFVIDDTTGKPLEKKRTPVQEVVKTKEERFVMPNVPKKRVTLLNFVVNKLTEEAMTTDQLAEAYVNEGNSKHNDLTKTKQSIRVTFANLRKQGYNVAKVRTKTWKIV